MVNLRYKTGFGYQTKQVISDQIPVSEFPVTVASAYGRIPCRSATPKTAERSISVFNSSMSVLNISRIYNKGRKVRKKGRICNIF